VKEETASPRGRCLNHYSGVHSPDGRCLGVVLVSRDLSERLELEKEHKRLRDHLFQQEKMVLIGQIAAGVAHELNTPLGTILLRAQLVLRQLKGWDDLSDLKMIESEAQRCRRIIDSLLSFSRRSEGAMAETDVTALIEESVSLVAKDLELRGIDVEYHHAQQGATVCVDPNQIQQVILNLITNAADAMASGGRVRISTQPLAGPGMLEICVTDNGCGMTPEVLAKACTPFFTTKQRRKGTGLGLAICRRIVEDHQGELAIKSQVGLGTSVSIRLPQVPSKVRADG
jgi:signal transduction histidine kinase